MKNIPWESISTFLTTYHVREVSVAVLLTVATFFLIRALRRQLKKLTVLAIAHKHRIPAIQFRRFELVSSLQVLRLIWLAGKVLRICLYAFILLLYLNILLGLFEETKFLNQAVLKGVLFLLTNAWVSFVAYLPNVLSIVFIVTLAYYFLKVAHLFFKAIGRGDLHFQNFHREWARPTYQILLFVSVALVLVMVFPLLPGFNSPAFQGIGVFLGLLVSLGSTGIVSNIIAGIMIIYMRSFQVGDRVSANNILGDIVEQTILVTKIRTIQNEEISIPNSILLTSPITNYSKEAAQAGLILHTAITIGYDAPWRQVHELLIAAANATGDIVADPEPHVFQKSLDDFYVSYEIRATTRQPNKMAKIYSDLHQNIQDQFNQAGVEIMSPHYRALRRGPSTIPAGN